LFEKIIMQKKVQFWMVMLVIASAAAVLSAPNETPKVTSADRAEPEVITNSIGMKVVRIPAGEFMMGAEEDRDATMAAFPYADPALLPREWPRHRVRIKIILHGAT
jgi:sulfatase modifying factor 1